ncbi:Zinc-uptake complex component A, substrate-binding, partial [Proteiniborus ethanoligenes]
MKRYIIGLFIIAILITGCSPSGNNSNSLNGDDKYRVVTTTTMIADLAKVIGGEYVEVQGLMGPGIDPHLYKASAGDVSLMQKSDMILY